MSPHRPLGPAWLYAGAVTLLVTAQVAGYLLVPARARSVRLDAAAWSTGASWAGDTGLLASPRNDPPDRASATAAKVTFPRSGPGTYVYAPGSGPVLGTGGTLHRFRVAVEKGVPVQVAEFATLVDATLGDRRSWIGDGRVRLRRVPAGRAYEFTVRLVTQRTAARLCARAGLDISLNGQPYTSCRVGDEVVINLTRYMVGIAGYGAPLSAYRQYVINHEVGHALGHGHELCAGRGRLAPVMQQQTLSMAGCRANAWPFVKGRRYAGPSGHL